jgi:hypothetical protein
MPCKLQGSSLLCHLSCVICLWQPIVHPHPDRSNIFRTGLKKKLFFRFLYTPESHENKKFSHFGSTFVLLTKKINGGKCSQLKSYPIFYISEAAIFLEEKFWGQILIKSIFQTRVFPTKKMFWTKVGPKNTWFIFSTLKVFRAFC